MSIIREKVEQAAGILDELGFDFWLTFARETGNNPDPILDLILGATVTWHSAFMITRHGETLAIVGRLEVPNTRDTGAYDEVVGFDASIKDDLLAALQRFDPKRIGINFSVSSVMADGLTHGLWLTLREYLKGTPYWDRLESAEGIIAALRGRKSPTELARISAACDAAQEILNMVSGFIRPGKTEKQAADFIIDEVKKRNLELAWDPAHCPAVFSGPESAGAHAKPTERTVERGHVLNVDFGVKKDGYCSDLQRTWYFLRQGEKKAPEAVERGFRTIIEAIRKAAAAIRPGKPGHEIDALARGHIVASGYSEYPHALGHQVGRVSHDGGGLLAPTWERYGNLPYLPLEVGNVFTLEPRLTVEGHGIATVEEEIVVTEDGFRYLSKPQTEIYLVE
jgi:Xaa-Pro aminopeptidase